MDSRFSSGKETFLSPFLSSHCTHTHTHVHTHTEGFERNLKIKQIFVPGCGPCDPGFQEENEHNDAATALLAWGKVLPKDGGGV